MTSTSAPGASGTPSTPPQRRRGAALEDAIRVAAFAELSEAGYHAFSVEAVAARAQTGKASIYRRWPTKQELVMDALVAELPEPADFGIPPAVDDDVTTRDALRVVARGIAGVMNGPAGDAIRAVKFEAMADPALAALVDERFQAPRRAALLGLLRRGIDRGEVRSDAVLEQIVDVLPAMLVYLIVMRSQALTEDDIAQVVENILLPLLATGS